MAAASLVASAIGIVLLLVTSYVLVGGLAQTTETVTSAQRDMTARSVRILETELSGLAVVNTTDGFMINMTNSGSEGVPVKYIDLFLSDSTSKTHYSYANWSAWVSESGTRFITTTSSGSPHGTAHQILQSGESLSIPCKDTCPGISSIQVTTGNGRSVTNASLSF